MPHGPYDIEGSAPWPGVDNILADPLFAPPPPDSAPWDTVVYDERSLQTTLTDSAASWSPGALVGLFVQPDDTDPRWFPIVANTATSLTLWGDVTDFVQDAASSGSPDTYLLHDLHLDNLSMCIDHGNGSVAPSVDIEDASRLDDGNPANNLGSGPPWVDIGAYEYHSP